MKRVLAALHHLLLLLLVGGCGGSSTDGPFRDVALVDLTCSSLDTTNGIWESASFPASSLCGGDAGTAACCPWIELPAHGEVRIEHGLGAVPRSVEPWISFSAFGVGSTVASGDALRLISADDTYLVLENHTDQRFYLRVAIQ